MAFIAFLVWVAYGVFQWRQAESWRNWVARFERRRRPLIAALLLFGSAAFLILALFGLWRTMPSGISMPGWFIITVVGLVFVHAQMAATNLLVSLAVTKAGVEASDQQENSP